MNNFESLCTIMLQSIMWHTHKNIYSLSSLCRAVINPKSHPMVIPNGILTCDVALCWYNPRSKEKKKKKYQFHISKIYSYDNLVQLDYV